MVALAVASLNVWFDLTPYKTVETFETLARVGLNEEMVTIIPLVMKLTEEKHGEGNYDFHETKQTARSHLFIVVQISLDSAQRSLF